MQGKSPRNGDQCWPEPTATPTLPGAKHGRRSSRWSPKRGEGWRVQVRTRRGSAAEPTSGSAAGHRRDRRHSKRPNEGPLNRSTNDLKLQGEVQSTAKARKRVSDSHLEKPTTRRPRRVRSAGSGSFTTLVSVQLETWPILQGNSLDTSDGTRLQRREKRAARKQPIGRCLHASI